MEINRIQRLFLLLEDEDVKTKVAEIFGVMKPNFQEFMADCLLKNIRGEELPCFRTVTLRRVYGELEKLVCWVPQVEVVPAPAKKGILGRIFS